MNQAVKQPPHESQTVEWKQSLAEWREIVETCAAFATSDGGVIYVGISPRGERIGLQVGQNTIEDVVNKIKVNTDPPQFPGVRVVGEEMSAGIEIEIEENPIKPVWAFGKPMKRVGKTNQHINRAGVIEQWGSGTLRIIKACKEYAISARFKVDMGCFIVTLKKSRTVKSQIGSPISSPKTEDQIMSIIKSDNHITTNIMAQRLGISKRAVLKQIDKLKKQGRLTHNGSARSGNWCVI